MSDDALASHWEKAWLALEEGAGNRKSPFHSFTLATLGSRGPEARTVILRSFDPGQALLRINSDSRAPKIQELAADPRCSVLFYGAEAKLQVRGQGRASLHQGDEVAQRAWQQAALFSRRCYLAPLAPGDPLEEEGGGLPPHLEGREPTPEESEEGWPFFSVVEIHLESLDILTLGSHGHRRALYEKARNWDGQWVSP